MKTNLFLCLMMSIYFSISAQTIEGNYYIPTSNGKITLSFTSQDKINYSGKMIGDDGSIYWVKAQSDQQGGIQGILSSDQTELGFAASLNDIVLNVILAPIGSNGDPDFSQAQLFQMNRMEQKNENPGQLAGPLMNSGNETTWSGIYYGNIGGTSSTLSLQQQDNTVQGKIDAGGYIYSLTGNLNNNQLEGILVDSQTQGSMKCKGSIQAGTINLVVNNQNNGQSFQITFSKNPENTNVANDMTSDKSGPGNVERDPGLIGNWLYTDSYTSGDYSFASQWRLIVNADGTYLYGDAKVAGGGPGVSGQSGGGDYTRGQWKTQNQTIYINEGSGWQPYAGYYIEGNSVLMKFADGSKQVWKRY
jgi:hypothetical protein